MTIEALVQQLIDRCDEGFHALSERVARLEEQVRACTAGIELNTAGYAAMDDSLVQHQASLQAMTARMVVLTDAMLRLENDLALTRESVAKQVSHEVEKQVDDLIPFAVLAQQQNGRER